MLVIMLVWMLRLSGVFPQVMSLSPGSRELPDSLNVLVRPFPTGMGWWTRDLFPFVYLDIVVVLCYFLLARVCVRWLYG